MKTRAERWGSEIRVNGEQFDPKKLRAHVEKLIRKSQPRKCLRLVNWKRDVRPLARAGMTPTQLLQAYRLRHKLTIEAASFKKQARRMLKRWGLWNSAEGGTTE